MRIFSLLAIFLTAPVSLYAACDIASYPLPNQQWRQISLPCAPGENNTVAAIFGDDIPGELGSDWALFRYDGDRYIPLDKSTDKLSQGVGYWIIQINDSGETRMLDLPDTSTPTPAGRFDIGLKTKGSAVCWNMIGYPFKYASPLSNARIVTASGSCVSGCSFDAAEAKKIVHNKLWTFNGARYTEVSAGHEFNPWTAYWLATQENAHAVDPISLSIALSNNAPEITKFVTEQSTSNPMLEISLEGSDDQGITGWIISEKPSTPDLDDMNWQRDPPSHYSLFSPGNVTLYAWAKDGSGGISNAATQNVNYALPTQYNDYLSDEFLQIPQNAIEFVKVSADFWTLSRDDSNGGFFTHVDQRGNVLGNRDKSFLTQSRNAYGFARAFMLTGDESYLDNARHALKFMYEHGWDDAHDGWYFMANEYGDINAGSGWEWDHNTKTKWSFQQHYALLGIAALYEASRNDTDYNWLTRGYDSNELHLWDSSPTHYGYYDLANKDWSAPRGKGFTPTVDAVTTNVLALYLLTQEEKYLNRLRKLGNNMIDHLAASIDEPTVKMGMIEKYNNDWSYKQSGWGWDDGDAGHVLKAGWSLGRIYLLTGDEKYRISARKFNKTEFIFANLCTIFTLFC
jgi:mannose/cellobiose epimerase-like protein (N-acyl-D-glucosamine 2-epimerase family)